jgi:hypothetical protein
VLINYCGHFAEDLIPDQVSRRRRCAGDVEIARSAKQFSNIEIRL